MKKWVGDGSFDFEIVGESYHQDELANIVGVRSRESAWHECVAELVPDNHNAHDANAVAVVIDGYKVGHLPLGNAGSYRQLLSARGADGEVTRCDAVITGGWIGTDSVGHFGVKLDLAEPFELRGRRERQMRAVPDFEPLPALAPQKSHYTPWQWFVSIGLVFLALMVLLAQSG